MSDDEQHDGRGGARHGRNPQRDNVIYANFGRRDRGRARDGGGRGDGGDGARASRRARPLDDDRSRTLSPGAARLVRAVTAATDQGRVDRGRAYAEGGNVLGVEFSGGRITAEVAGSQPDPFHTTIELPYRSADDLTEVARRLAESTDGARRARQGDVDGEVLDILLGAGTGDIRFHCDCPDMTTACKHAVAVSEVAAQRLIKRPALMFEVRGLDIDQMVAEMSRHAREVSADSASGDNEAFWGGRELPGLPDPKVAPALDDSDTDLLHQAMRQVSYTSIEQLRAVSDIEDLYDHLTGSDTSPRSRE